MPDPAPLLLLTQINGGRVHIHVDRVVKVTPSDPEPAPSAGPKPECGSTLTLAAGAGTGTLGVAEYLLNIGPSELAGFLRLTDLHGMPIKINPNYVILLRAGELSGSILEIQGAADIEAIPVRDSLESLIDWWSVVARTRLTDPGRGW